jgi:glycosyltransferase involved in cell wall biosynthesis
MNSMVYKDNYLGSSNPFISVIITAYNRKEYLLDAFKSAVNQTLPRDKYEIIVTKNFKDKKIDKYIKKHGGKLIFFEKGSYGEQLADALKYARGEVICFLEDDDLSEKERLERIYYTFKKNNKLVYIHNADTYIDEFGNPLKKGVNKFEKIKKDIYIGASDKNIINLLRIQQYANPCFNASSIAIRRSVLNKFKKELKSVKFAPDFFFYLISLVSGDLLLLKDKLTKYRVHASTSLSIENYEKFKNTILKFESKDLPIAILRLYKSNLDFPNSLKKYFLVLSWDQEITYYFYAGNYRRKVLINYLKIFPYLFFAYPKIAILRGLQVVFYIIAPEKFRRFNYERTKKYIKSLR